MSDPIALAAHTFAFGTINEVSFEALGGVDQWVVRFNADAPKNARPVVRVFPLDPSGLTPEEIDERMRALWGLLSVAMLPVTV